MRYTPSEQKKIVQTLEELGYRVRYEKGVFESSPCMLREQNIFVLNKFLDTTAQINRLIEFILTLELESLELSSDQKKRIDSWLRSYEMEQIKSST